MSVGSYTGVSNLEVMEDALNYNAFLESLILRHAGRGRTIMDFGAGLGTFTRRVGAHGYDLVAVESDPTMLAQLKGEGIHAVASAVELPANSVDGAFTLNVLEHIEDDVAALSEIRCALRPGGVLLVYVPAFMILYGPMDECIGHFRRYTRKSLRTAATEAGFQVKHIGYVDSIGFLAQLFLKYFGSADGSINGRAVKLYDRFIFPMSRTFDHVAGRLFGKNICAICVKV